jgi:Fn3 associated
VTLDSIGGFLVADSGNNALRQIQTSAPQPPVSDPVIGWVSWQKDQFGDPVSQLVPVTHSVFNNDVIIAIRAESGTKTYFTYGATPLNSLQDTIPSPDDPSVNRSTPSPYQDGLHTPDVPPSIIQPQPDVTIKAVGTADNRKPSSIVQARFQFQTANPSVLGENAASFVVTNITAGAQMWYTTDGSDPVANGPGSTNVVNGPVSLPRSLIPITFKIRAFRTDFTDSEVVTKVFSPENFQANRISFGFENGEASSQFVAAAGQRFFAPVTLSLLPTQNMFTLQFNVTVTSLNASPAADPSKVGFESMLMEKITSPDGVAYRQIPPALFLGGQSGPPGVDSRPGLGNLRITNSSANLLAVGWLERSGATNLYDTKQQDLITYSIAHDTLFLSAQQKVIVGGYSFVVPQNASAGDTYQIQIARPSATSDGVNQDNYIEAVTDGTLTATPTNLINSIKWVTVGQRSYVVGDVAPFHWFNAGDFGDSLLLNNDVVQVFQSAIYLVNRPPVGSDFFDAMDSSNGLTNNLATNLFSGDDLVINSIQFGDGSLNVDDVYVTFRRSLDPSLTWYARSWANGQLQAVPVNNVSRGAPDLPGQLLSSAPNLPAASFIPGEPSAAFSVDDLIVTPGQTLQIPVRSTVVGQYPLRVLMLNLSVEPLDGSPPMTQPVEFTPAATLGTPTLTSSRGPLNFAGAWLNNQVAGVAGPGVVGTLTVVIPTNAPPSAAYRVHFDHISASPNGLGLFPRQVQDGLLTLRDRSSSSLGDGIPDTWRLRYFGSISDPLAQASADPDGDGVSNLAEFLAGTNPVDSNSRLCLAAHRQLNTGNGSPLLTLRWPSCPNKRYTVEAASSLTSGYWTELGSGLVGTGQELEFTPAAPADSTQFFRVRVSE